MLGDKESFYSNMKYLSFYHMPGFSPTVQILEELKQNRKFSISIFISFKLELVKRIHFWSKSWLSSIIPRPFKIFEKFLNFLKFDV